MWFKVDDKLHDHRKVRKAGKAAMGVWVLAGSWAMDNETDGFIPSDVLPRWGTKSDANKLVAAGLWDAEEHRGEQGWRFHDWSRFQPSAAVTAAKRAAEHEAGVRGNHKRWHVDRKIVDPNCEYCYRVPDREPDTDPMGVPESAPIPPVPVPEPLPTSPNGEVGVVPPRDDVMRICRYLVDALVENGCKRPAITKTWQEEARKLLDLDGRTEAEVIGAIDWCQRGTSDRSLFWRSNVLSMTKLRAKFDQMRLQATEEARKKPPMSRVDQHMALAQRLYEEEQAQIGEIQ